MLVSTQSLGAAAPLGRFTEPHEVADLVVFLASDRAASITDTADRLFVSVGGSTGGCGLGMRWPSVESKE